MAKKDSKEKPKKKLVVPETEYNDSDIEHYADTAGIRMRPTMYIGALGTEGVKHLLQEGLDNSFDESRGGFCTEIFVGIDEKGQWLTIIDDGRGIPPKSIEKVATKTHAGGKFKSSAYKYSRGMNGVGLKAINALSTELIIKVKRDGYEWEQTFAKGEPTSKLKRLGPSKETGTTIRFHPDKEVMHEVNVKSSDIADLCEKLTYLNKGVTIVFHATTADGKEINKRYHSKNGILDYIGSLEKNQILKQPILFTEVAANMEAEIAFSYCKGDSEIIVSHCNGAETSEHGNHVQGFKMALTKVIGKYIVDNKMISKKDGKICIEGDDCREGLVAVVNVKHADPEFANQTKTRLTNNDILGFVNKMVTDKLTALFTDAKTKDIAKTICERTILAAKARVSAKRAREHVRKSNDSFTAFSSLAKLTTCTSTNPEENELYIVEGDSAGGSASQGRDPVFQSIFKLRGKPLNSYEARLNRLMDNTEIRELILSLGTGIGKEFDISKLTHHKIIIMTDADVDGLHIRCLLLTFFVCHMPELVRRGHVYVAQPPLYMVGGKTYIQDKVDFNAFVLERMMEKYRLARVVDKNPIEMGKEELTDVLATTRNYLTAVNNAASHFAVLPEIIETIAFFKGRKKQEKLYAKLKSKYDLAAKSTPLGLHVSGLVGNDFQSFYINDELFERIQPIIDVARHFEYAKFAMSEVGKKKWKTTSLSNFLSIVTEAAVPKQLKRFKGLGEMQPEQLWETAMDPAKRKLIRIAMGEEEEAQRAIYEQMGNNADTRKVSLANFKIDPEDIDG